MFVDNIFLKGAVYLNTIRSPLEYGKLFSVECPALIEEPEAFSAYRLISARDIPGLNYLDEKAAMYNADFSHPILAENELLYLGQPIALLAGPDPAKLAALSARVVINAEKQNPVQKKYAELNVSIPIPAKENVSAKQNASGTLVVSGTYKTPDARHNASECTGAFVVFENERCVVHTATQWPRHIEDSISKVLGIPLEIIDVRRETLGRHYDAKIWYPSLIAVQAALAAYITKKPVKFMLSREEEMLYSPRRAPACFNIKTEIDSAGHAVKTDIDIEVNLGAAGFFAEEILDRISLAALSFYKLGAVTLRAKALSSAQIPMGAFSGFGLAQGFFAIERHVTKIAQELRMPPVEWKLENTKFRVDKLAIGIAVNKTVPLPAILETVDGQSNFARKWSAYELLRLRAKQSGERSEPLRGIGISFSWQGAGFLHHFGNNPLPEVTAFIENRTLVFRCASAKASSSKINIWKELLLEAAVNAADDVRYETSAEWGDDPSSLSQELTHIPALLESAGKSAALLPQTSPPSASTLYYKSADVKSWSGKSVDSKVFANPSYCAAVVEVEIDTVEFKSRIRGVWLCVEGGKILSIQDASNALVVSSIAALSWAAGKQEVPNIKDVPHIEIDFIPSDNDNLTGLEELAFSTIPAAYASAVSQALNVNFESLPVTPIDIWKALNYKEAQVSENGSAA